MYCSECNIYDDLPFTCHYCKLTLCSDHHLPENHNCSQLYRTHKPGDIQYMDTSECSYNGDITGDGQVDILDIVALVNAILDGTEIYNGDINLDNEINVLDIVALVNIILNS